MQNKKHIDTVEFFFGSEPIGKKYSSLALLRNDIRSMGREINTYYFPRSICLMVVIDLLSKMRFGDSGDYGQVGKRFKDFVNEFHNEENISIDIGVILYAFRNALHHSFNMATNVRLGDVDAYNFCLISAPSDQRLLSVNSNVVKINFNALEVFVNNLIESYKTHILHCENDAECDKFSVMLQKYGIMRIG